MKSLLKNVEKLEEMINNSNYILRYEKGNFKSGWCLLDEKRIVILNKFLQMEDRQQILMDLIPQLDILFDNLTFENQQLYNSIIKKNKVNNLF